MINCYYINLKRSPDRNTHMKIFFKKLSRYTAMEIKYKRIEGLDGNANDINNYLYNNIKFNELKSTYFKNNGEFYYGYRINSKKIYEKSLKKSEFGCLYSHLKAINEFYNSKDRFALIFEDDISYYFVYKNSVFIEKLNQVIKNIDKYGIISLSSVGNYNVVNTIIRNNFLWNKNNLYKFYEYYFYGTGCYIISRNAAKKILELYTEKIDGVLKLKVDNLNKSLVADNLLYSSCNTHVLLPSLFFIKDDNKSLIDNDTDEHNKVQNFMIESINSEDKFIEKKKDNYDTIKVKKKPIKLNNNQLLTYLKYR